VGTGRAKDCGTVRGKFVLLYCQYAATHGLGTRTLHHTKIELAHCLSTVHLVVACIRHCLQQLPERLPTSLCKSVGQRFSPSSRHDMLAYRE